MASRTSSTNGPGRFPTRPPKIFPARPYAFFPVAVSLDSMVKIAS